MKLFDDFEAVRFPEENLIFITHGGFLYYIYQPKDKWWRKYENAGNDYITVRNYQDVTREEIIEAMKGKFPAKETDFMRFCNSSQLCIRDMLDLMREDYANYFEDGEIYRAVHRFLLESDVCHKSYELLRELFDKAINNKTPNKEVLSGVKQLSLRTIGRDIYRAEIGIVDGHDCSSYFWIMPKRVIDYENTNNYDNVAEMRSLEISIEEDDVAQYLTPFLDKYFDENLEANKKRVDNYWEDEDGNEQASYIQGFEWYLTDNFYTFDSIESILSDIRETVDALSSGHDNEYSEKLREKRGTATYELIYAKNLSDEQVKEYNANRPKQDDTEIGLIVDFYERFLYRMEYMLKVGKEKGYDLISFMGP